MISPKHLTISELHRALNSVLEREFSRVTFIGEITEVSLWSSGHLYFTLKDAESQISGVMWRSSVVTLKFKPKQGDVVVCTGRPNIYNKNGRFQMVVHSMEPSGEGVLQKKFQELKEKLEREGLFSPERKRTLPFFPSAIGVVTSSQGAVIHDIMVRIRARMPHLIVYLADVKVQGPGAAEEIADGIRRLNMVPEIEVIIVARGGGSLEDLWAFNEEIVVRAIYASRIPVISGVGHEVDVTLSDLVADVRAPTPTAAAEMVVPHRDDLTRLVSELERRLQDTDRWLQPLGQALDDCEARLVWATKRILSEARLRVENANSNLRTIHPAQLLEQKRAKIEIVKRRLGAAGEQNLTHHTGRVTLAAHRLNQAFPVSRIGLLAAGVDKLATRSLRAVENVLQSKSQAAALLSEKLKALSPQHVLDRGFAIVTGPGGLIRRAKDLRVEDSLRIAFAEGTVSAKVLEIGE